MVWIGIGIGIIVGFLLGTLFAVQKFRKRMFSDKKKEYHIRTINDFLSNKNNDVMCFFKDHNYSSCIVYGLGAYYQTFLDMLDQERITIYLCDKKAYGDKIYSPSQIGDINADIIVVTAISYFEEIANELRTLYGEKREIFSFQDILFYAAKENK